jgi:methionine synthase II (cobalamin-independent)
VNLNPAFLTTHLGSVPHPGDNGLSGALVNMLDIPAWPQFPRRVFQESMYVQYITALPGIRLDEASAKAFFDTSGDLTPALEAFYTRYLAGDVDSFALPPEYAVGFYGMLDRLRGQAGEWAKGQVTGPVSTGLTVTDQNLRASLYDEALADVIVKNAAMNARWQVRQLKAVRENVLIFVDEPYMAAFGSAYVSLGRDQVVSMLDEVFAAIHEEGGLSGVHCCGNTDWSVLLATGMDVLNLDAYYHLEKLALYPADLRAFLDRGGMVAWGIVPNNEELNNVTAEQIAGRLREGLDLIGGRAARQGIAIDPAELGARSLITPSCGLGSTTVDIAHRALRMLGATAEILRGG